MTAIDLLRWRWYPFAHIVLFQCAWFACVAGAAAGKPLLGPLVAIALLALHALMMARPLDELRLAGIAVMLGSLADSLLIRIRVLDCVSADGPLAPAWMVALWPLFAVTLHTYCRWLLGRYALAAMLGALAGPLAYFAGVKLGALRLPLGVGLGLGAIAIEWLICTPILVWTAGRFSGAPPSLSAKQKIWIGGEHD